MLEKISSCWSVLFFASSMRSNNKVYGRPVSVSFIWNSHAIEKLLSTCERMEKEEQKHRHCWRWLSGKIRMRMIHKLWPLNENHYQVMIFGGRNETVTVPFALSGDKALLYKAAHMIAAMEMSPPLPPFLMMMMMTFSRC